MKAVETQKKRHKPSLCESVAGLRLATFHTKTGSFDCHIPFISVPCVSLFLLFFNFLCWFVSVLTQHPKIGRSRNWPKSKLAEVEIGRSRNWPKSKLAEVEIGRSRNWPKSKLAEIEIGRSRTIFFSFLFFSFLFLSFLFFSFLFFSFLFCSFLFFSFSSSLIFQQTFMWSIAGPATLHTKTDYILTVWLLLFLFCVSLLLLFSNFLCWLISTQIQHPKTSRSRNWPKSKLAELDRARADGLALCKQACVKQTALFRADGLRWADGPAVGRRALQ